MMKFFTLLAVLILADAVLLAQVQPAATGPVDLNLRGAINYALRYSQIADFYGNKLGSDQRGIVSGDLGYANNSERLPFRLTFSGGYSREYTGKIFGPSAYESTLLSQSFVSRSWSLMLSDIVSYMNQSPTTGFSGIPGTGEPIGQGGSTPNQSALTLNTIMVTNDATAGFSRQFGAFSTLSLGGSSLVLYYPDGNGIGYDSTSANAAFTRQLNARMSLQGQYGFDEFSYPGNTTTLNTHMIRVGFDRQWTRQLESFAYAGPQWVLSSNSKVEPGSTNFSADAGIKYALHNGSASLTYTHGINGGSGYYYGAEDDMLIAALTREFGRNYDIEFYDGYLRTGALGNQNMIDTEYGAAQATRRLGRHIEVFANYTVTDQWSNSQLPSNALTSLWQMISFGVGYTSAPKQLVH